MFAQRLTGRSTAGIARELNERAVPCPSGYDRERNAHRSGEAWTLRSVAAILANPQYTGRQVWNRQQTDHGPETPGSGVARGKGKLRWNPQDQWIVSRREAHPGLVTERDFVAVQAVRAKATPRDGSTRAYRFTGLVRCGVCDRRMVGHWVHDRAGYRCRHGQTTASSPRSGRPKWLYVREDRLCERVAAALERAVRPCGADDAAAYLRASGAQVIWSAGGVTLGLRPNPTADRLLLETPTAVPHQG